MRILYEDLVFPEVEELARDWPVIVPLGSGSLPTKLPGQHQIIMPALPFGFAPPLQLDAFQPLVESLKQVLAEDGFSQVHLVATTEPPWQPPSDLAQRVVLLATGHTEQHGFHLPLSTDTVIVEGLAVALEKTFPRLLRLPAWPYGVSMHRRQFPGTLTIDPRVWEDFWVEAVGALRELGARKFYLLNGHGGNHSFLVNAVKYMGDRWPDIFAATSFLHTSSGAAARLLEAERGSSLMGHACELETSYLLHLRPELVRMQWAVDEVDFVATERYQVDWVSDGVLVANPCWSDDTRTGAYGAPSFATAAKGKRWLRLAVEELVCHLEEVEEQQRQRLKRRAQGWVEGAWKPLWESRSDSTNSL